MTNLQAFLLGIMVALTPSAIAMVFLLRRAPKEGSYSECLKKEHELPVIPIDQASNGNAGRRINSESTPTHRVRSR